MPWPICSRWHTSCRILPAAGLSLQATALTFSRCVSCAVVPTHGRCCSAAAPLQFHPTGSVHERQLCLPCVRQGETCHPPRALECFSADFQGQGEEGKPPTALSGALPPFLWAELQPLFCSTPRGILSPSTMKSVTFKLLYCNLGTFALSAVTRRWAPATQRCIPPHAIANIYRSGSSLHPTVSTLGTTFVLVFSPGSDR